MSHRLPIWPRNTQDTASRSSLATPPRPRTQSQGWVPRPFPPCVAPLVAPGHPRLPNLASPPFRSLRCASGRAAGAPRRASVQARLAMDTAAEDALLQLDPAAGGRGRSRDNVLPVSSSGSESEGEDGEPGRKRAWMQVTARTTAIRVGAAHQAVLPGPEQGGQRPLSVRSLQYTDAKRGPEAPARPQGPATAAASADIAAGPPSSKKSKS